MATRNLMEGRKRTAVKRFSINNLLIALLLVCLTALVVRSAPPSKLEQVRTTGELRVLSRNGPISHYQSPEGITGYEYTLLKGFADDLGVKLVLQDDEQTNERLQKGQDLAVDLVSPSVIGAQASKDHFRFASPIMELSLQLVYNNTQSAPASLKDLAGKHVVMVNKASVPMPLQELQQAHPEIQWEQVENVEMTDLMEMVDRGHADYALVDSAIYDIHHFSYPHTQVAFQVSKPQPLAWAFAESRDMSLYNAAQRYLKRIQQSGQLAQVYDRFFTQSIEVNSDDAMMFTLRLEKRLPHWQSAIQTAANQYNLDWRLVAAVGYQESQWIPNAQSPTGVRGFMMLTPDTAKELGVRDLDDPKQSIHGGAKYLRYLLDNLPDSIKGDEERLNFALAAYNQGMGHLDDARALTRRLKGDPNSWQDVSKVFPLLAKQPYYSKATCGYARGWEPVIYVKAVLNYQKIMEFKEKQEQIRVATSTSDELEFNDTIQAKSALEKINHMKLSSASTLSFL